MKFIEKLKASYDEPSKIDGYGDLKEGEKEKVQRAWDEGHIPDDDKGPGEAVDTGKKKAAAPRKKKADDGEEKPKRSRAKAKVCLDAVINAANLMAYVLAIAEGR